MPQDMPCLIDCCDSDEEFDDDDLQTMELNMEDDVAHSSHFVDLLSNMEELVAHFMSHSVV